MAGKHLVNGLNEVVEVNECYNSLDLTANNERTQFKYTIKVRKRHAGSSSFGIFTVSYCWKVMCLYCQNNTARAFSCLCLPVASVGAGLPVTADHKSLAIR